MMYKIRHILFWLTAISLAVAPGCARLDSAGSDPDTTPVLLQFCGPVIVPATKAAAGLTNAEMPTTYDEQEHFTVSALFHRGNYKNASEDQDGNATSSWMDLVDCGFESGVNGWSGGAGYTDAPYNSGNDYYWPPAGTGKLSFIAFSPSAIREAATVSGGLANGFTFTDFAVPAAGSQYDVLYSDRTLNRERSNYSAGDSYDDTAGDSGSRNGVDIAFHHALSSIVFQARTGDDYAGTTYSIKKIEILNAYGQGTFVQGLTDDNNAATYQTGFPAWTPATDSETNYVAFEGSVDLTTTPVSTTGKSGNNVMLLLPQPLHHTTTTNNVTIRLTYGQNTGGTELLRTSLINLYNGGSYYQDQSTNPISSWEIGKRYTYTFVITLNRIFFDPAVTPWKDASVTPDIDI